MVAKILDGKQIAKEYRQRLKNQVNDLKEYGFTPKLSVQNNLENYEKSLVAKVEEMQNELQ